jgi:hypothetical protein
MHCGKQDQKHHFVYSRLCLCFRLAGARAHQLLKCPYGISVYGRFIKGGSTTGRANAEDTTQKISSEQQSP